MLLPEAVRSHTGELLECSSVWLFALLDLEQFEHFDGARYWGSLNKLKGNLVWKEKKQDLGLVDVIEKLA